MLYMLSAVYAICCICYVLYMLYMLYVVYAICCMLYMLCAMVISLFSSILSILSVLSLLSPPFPLSVILLLLPLWTVRALQYLSNAGGENCHVPIAGSVQNAHAALHRWEGSQTWVSLESDSSRCSASAPLCASNHLVQAAELPAHSFGAPHPNGVDRNGGHMVGWDTTPTLLLNPLQ